MTWYKPRNLEQMVESIGKSWQFHSPRQGLEGAYVAVLSAPLPLGVNTKHALTDKVIEGARLIRHNYMKKGIRERHPDAPVYYVKDVRTRRVLIVMFRNGEVQEELDILRPDLRQGTRDKIREAMRSIKPDALSY